MTTVIYHSADYDGIFCREIAKKFLGEKDVAFIGWNFGDPPIKVNPGNNLIVMDLPLDRPFGWPIPLIYIPAHGSLTWIDHHKSSIESHPADIPGYRIDGVAACRLAWQWFSKGYAGGKGMENSVVNNLSGKLPSKEDFVDRKVSEPIAVRLAGEYDVWDHRGDGDLEFQYGLRTEEPDIHWDWLFDKLPHYSNKLLDQGMVAMKYSKNMDAFWLAEAGHIIEWEGLKFLAKNSVERGSGILDSKDIPETGHDALMLYGYRGKYWTVSLYHAKHRTDLDLSQIAVKHGGGGHRGACGFTCQKLPFLS